MASNISLYSATPSTTVSSNNFTTLYNTTVGNVVTANVPDKNFTTLYTTQDVLKPTLPYGNANVEAFLNVGSDVGGNQVQNIHMSGNIYVGSQSYLGSISNVHIDGGTLNYILKTDGAGNLAWTPQVVDTANATPFIHFDVVTTANNQQFANSLLANYASNNEFNLFKNGVNIEPFYYTKINGNTVQVNILLNIGDTIDILASGAGGASAPGGNLGEIQYNGGSYLSGNSSFTFDQVNSLMTVGNVTVVNNTNLGNVGNVHITGGNANYVLQTDGTGNLNWVSFANSLLGGSNTQVQFNDANTFGGNANFTYNKTTSKLTVSHIAGEGGNISNVTAANITGIVANANYSAFAGSATTAVSATTAGTAVYAENSNIANIANIANVAYNIDGANVTGYVLYANIANTALTVAGANVTGTVANATYAVTSGSTTNAVNITGASQPNITSLGTLTNLTVSGNLIMQRGYEKFTTVGTGATGTINFDVITQSILYYSANATGNVTLNVRGNSTVTLNSIQPANNSMSIVFLNTVGTTAYLNTVLQIDGNTVIPSWTNGLSPASSVSLTNAKQSYTYTVMKTAGNTYTVLGSFTEYQ